MPDTNKHFDLAPPPDQRGLYDQENGGYQTDFRLPARRVTVPVNNGTLPDYRPASAVVEAESSEQARRVTTTRRQARSALGEKARNFVLITVAAGVGLLAVTELARVMGNQEKAPWEHTPTDTRPHH